jgi:hypothetical protein
VGVRDIVIKALDDGMADGVKVLCSAALAKAAGGEPIEAAVAQFAAGLALEIKLHDSLVAAAERALERAMICGEGERK